MIRLTVKNIDLLYGIDMKLRYKLFCVFGFVLVAGFFIPDTRTNPVSGATLNDWHQNSFWYEPWGSSGVHKGIDIFATKGTELVSSTPGIVLYQGHLTKGGQVILVLGPKWRLHYYAHLNSINVDKFENQLKKIDQIEKVEKSNVSTFSNISNFLFHLFVQLCSTFFN